MQDKGTSSEVSFALGTKSSRPASEIRVLGTPSSEVPFY